MGKKEKNEALRHNSVIFQERESVLWKTDLVDEKKENKLFNLSKDEVFITTNRTRKLIK